MPQKKRPLAVTMGGGTGHSVVLSGLKDYEVDLTAIVAVTDDGGSSGRLRNQFGAIPPGDIRQCLSALAPIEIAPVVRKLFEYRFPDDGELNGHSFGNLFLVALERITGSLPSAIETAGSILGTTGRVLPVSLENTHLQALLDDGTHIKGESLIDLRGYQPGAAIVQVSLDPPVAAYPPALQSIKDADLLVLGPGDLYTSLLPVILTGGVTDSICTRQGLLVYVCNLMTKPGETDGFDAAGFLNEIHRYLKVPVGVILANRHPIPENLLSIYAAAGAYPVSIDAQACQDLGVEVITAPMLAEGELIRHDPKKLAEALIKL